MNDPLPVVYLARHGDTAWTVSGQHTGPTDLPLISNGEFNAKHLGERLSGLKFARVITSPLQRATHTRELPGFGAIAELDPDLTAWDYGEYEGLLSADIHAKRPNWELFCHGCPGGESTAQVTERADRVIQRVRAIEHDVLRFSSGHFIRVLASRWLALSSWAGEYLLLNPASLTALSYEHKLSHPAVRFWNETNHVVA
jgi:broad specificity phosphatase PhoE